jgi:GNAT superfamily N-acetyltransferase
MRQPKTIALPGILKTVLTVMPEISIDWERPDTADASALVAELEAYLSPQYPPASQHGLSVDQLIKEKVAFFVLRSDGKPAGCGGIQCFGSEYAELKRFYVRPDFRRKGLGKILLRHLEEFARAQRIPVVRLETGILQHEAMRLYEQTGYKEIPAFGPYAPDPLSAFYEKQL